MEVRQRRLPPPGFGAMLRAARERRGLSQRQVAEGVRIERSYLANLEHDSRVPSGVVAAGLAEVLQLTADERAQLLAVAVTDAGRGSRRRARLAAQGVA